MIINYHAENDIIIITYDVKIQISSFIDNQKNQSAQKVLDVIEGSTIKIIIFKI